MAENQKFPDIFSIQIIQSLSLRKKLKLWALITIYICTDGQTGKET